MQTLLRKWCSFSPLSHMLRAVSTDDFREAITSHSVGQSANQISGQGASGSVLCAAFSLDTCSFILSKASVVACLYLVQYFMGWGTSAFLYHILHFIKSAMQWWLFGTRVRGDTSVGRENFRLPWWPGWEVMRSYTQKRPRGESGGRDPGETLERELTEHKDPLDLGDMGEVWGKKWGWRRNSGREDDFSLRHWHSRFMGPSKQWCLECHGIDKPRAWKAVCGTVGDISQLTNVLQILKQNPYLFNYIPVRQQKARLSGISTHLA